MISLFMIVVAGCSMFSPKPVFNINLEAEATTDSDKPFTVIVAQPQTHEEFSAMDYQTLSSIALKQGIYRYVVSPEVSSSRHIEIMVNDSPLAVYFVFANTPITQWKYYFNKPKGMSKTFTLKDGYIIQG